MINLPGPAFLSDQNGNYCTGEAGFVPATTNIVGAATSQTGAVIAAGINAAGLVTPFALDAQGAISSRQLAWPTVAFAPAAFVATGTAAGKSMLSVYNAGVNYFRLLGLRASCPPQTSVSGALTAVTSSYNSLPFGAYFFTAAHTAGTPITAVSHDSRNSIDAAFTCRTGASISGQGASAVFYWDAGQNTQPVAGRTDQSAQLIVLGPNQGITFNNLMAQGTSVNFVFSVAFSQSTT